MSHSFIERNNPYNTVGENRNFIFKEYTPNKRKKIFDGT